MYVLCYNAKPYKLYEVSSFKVVSPNIQFFLIEKKILIRVFNPILRGGAPIRTNFPHFLTNLFKSNIFGFYVFKLEEARIFFCEKSYGCHGNGGHLGKYLKFLNR